VRQGYRLKKNPGDLRELTERLDARFAAREERDLARLREALEYAGFDSCLTGYLTGRFGEELGGPCGHCDRCRGVAPQEVPGRLAREPDEEELMAVQELVAEGHSSLGSPRQLARFLCGLRSPASSRERLGRHDAFGLLAGLPFEEVLLLTESMGGG